MLTRYPHLVLAIFSWQLFIRQKVEAQNQKRKLIEANQAALELTNEKLEQQVSERTAEMIKANVIQRSILEGAGYALIATDEHGTITVFNPAAEKLLGYSAMELVDKQTPAIFHLEAEVIERAELLSQQHGINVKPGFEVFVLNARLGNVDTNCWTYVRKDFSHVPVRLSVTALFDDDGELFGFLGIAYDQIGRAHV